MALDVRTVLAAVLGVLLGAFLLAYPEVAIRIHVAGRRPPGRGGEYGSDGSPGRWALLVRVLGAAAILVGGYIGVSALL